MQRVSIINTDININKENNRRASASLADSLLLTCTGHDQQWKEEGAQCYSKKIKINMVNMTYGGLFVSFLHSEYANTLHCIGKRKVLSNFNKHGYFDICHSILDHFCLWRWSHYVKV